MFILGHVYELVIGNVDEERKCPLKAVLKHPRPFCRH